MAKRRASERHSANSKSAGINLRRARSPDAPKITMVQGSATATELCGSRVALSAISLVRDAINYPPPNVRFTPLSGKDTRLPNVLAILRSVLEVRRHF